MFYFQSRILIEWSNFTFQFALFISPYKRWYLYQSISSNNFNSRINVCIENVRCILCTYLLLHIIIKIPRKSQFQYLYKFIWSLISATYIYFLSFLFSSLSLLYRIKQIEINFRLLAQRTYIPFLKNTLI